MFSYNCTRNCTLLARGNEFLTRFEGRYCGTIAKIHFHGKFLQRLFRCSGERNDAIPSGGGESMYVYIVYIYMCVCTRLCPGNIEPRPFYRPELSSPPWYLFNTDATPQQPFLSYRLAQGVYLYLLLLLPPVSNGKVLNNNF